MKPPAKVKVGPFTYDVVFDSDALNRIAIKADDTSGLDGAVEFNDHVVFLHGDRAPDFIREVFLHELLHTLTDMLGIRHELDDDLEEKLVRRLSPPLLALLRDNPKLVAYLTE